LWFDFKQDYISHYPRWDYLINNYDGVGYYKITPDKFSALWEYQIKLISEKAPVCEENCNWNGNCSYSWSLNPVQINHQNVCLMNFSVTRPYIIQKWTLVSTVNNDILDDFYNLDWSKVVNSSDLVQLKNVVSNYDWDWVKKVVNNFISKYEKLAIKLIVDLSVYWIEFANPVAWKKFSDKNIIFVDWWWNNLVINSINISKPTTLIIKNSPKVTIKWNVYGNLMLIVPDGEIYFDSVDCDHKQVVNGIYITLSWFDTEHIINDDFNKSWCWDWRLEVKGILIGQNVDNLWQKRRSVLKDWFSSDKIQNIKQWGSLIIDTNTNLWSNLPPGAEDILTQIKIYKK
jgi:hypothetical protein